MYPELDELHLEEKYNSSQVNARVKKYAENMLFGFDFDLDLKKAASVTGDKKIEMIHVKELLGLTGYIRGGCSPVGMKKKYPTYIDETAVLFDEIYVSAGLRGQQVILNPEDLRAVTEASFADLTKR